MQNRELSVLRKLLGRLMLCDLYSMFFVTYPLKQS